MLIHGLHELTGTAVRRCVNAPHRAQSQWAFLSRILLAGRARGPVRFPGPGFRSDRVLERQYTGVGAAAVSGNRLYFVRFIRTDTRYQVKSEWTVAWTALAL